ncbi:unnamed protein product [Notodromas monacha]|uniref:Globin domain-containing protein n=1 Tax=Notodromas monacha TaxID=399045 RepID=A0A7R9GIW1_9CRUS|nr:unnamed protein product [Notodromas monacha]CAG0924238.1 unnamed protein product [Notodromas monacha]
MGNALSSAEQAALKKSWAAIKPNAQKTGIETFVKLFKDNPKYKAKFWRIKDVSNDKLNSNKALHCHSLMFTRAVGAMAENIEDTQMIDEVCHRLAYRHRRLNINEKDLKVATDIFIDKMGSGVDTKVWKTAFDKMNPTVGKYMKELEKAGI